MLNKETLAAALSAVSDEYIEDARAALGYPVGATKSRRSHKKLWRTVLIAAILAALFTITAYATGWFGLSGLKIGKNEFGRDVISIQGLADSPEARGLKEWNEYIKEYMYGKKRWEEIDEELARELGRKYGMLGCNTREDEAKLLEICEKYGLRPLGGSIHPENERAFYEAAGTGRLAISSGEMTNYYVAGYLFEDGSFSIQSDIREPGRPYPIGYDFRRSMKGTLSYITGNLDDVNAYDEWDMEAGGMTLHLANSDSSSLIIAESEDAFYLVSIGHESIADYVGDGRIDGIGDEYVTFTLSRGELENIARCFDWEALTDPERGMDTAFNVYEYTGTAPSSLIEAAGEPDFGNAGERDLYWLKLAYNEGIEPYISGFQLIDHELEDYGGQLHGWVQFSGAPKTALDWKAVTNGAEKVYCRSVNMKSADGGQWEPMKNYDMLPCHSISLWENIGTETEPDYIRHGTELPEILSASLYVQQLDRSFPLSDAEALEQLRKMLVWGSDVGGGVTCLEANPLYITLSDGRKLLAYTSADGSDNVRLFGGSRSYGLGMSIFELFDVPLEAAGYSRNNGVVTTHKDLPERAGLDWMEFDYIDGGRATARRIHDYRGVTCAKYEYDEHGNMLRETWYDENNKPTALFENKYTDDGRILLSTTTIDGLVTQKVEYEYDGMGRLTAELHPKAPGANLYYNYDEQGRCRVVHGFELAEQGEE